MRCGVLYLLISDLVFENLVYSVFSVLPTYCLLHLLHVIRYMIHSDLQVMWLVMGNCLLVTELLNFVLSEMNLCMMHFLDEHL